MIANYQPELDTIRPKEIGFLKNLVKLRQNGLAYLLKGSYMKNIPIAVPSEKLTISKLSIYAGQNEKVKKFEKEYPTFYHAVWKANDGGVGIAVSNINTEGFWLKTTIQAKEYGLADSGTVYDIDADKKNKIGHYQNGVIHLDQHIAAVSCGMIEIVPN